MKIRDIRSKDISNTISVEGEVSTINEIRPKLKTAAYMCNICEGIVCLPVEGSEIGKPVHCENESCGKRSDFIHLEDKSSKTDSQQIEIKELDNICDPRSLIVHLEGDLVDTIKIEDKIVVIGVLKAHFQSTSTTGDFVLEANSVEKMKEKKVVSDNKEGTDSSGEIQIIREIIDQLRLSSPSDKVLLEDIYREASNLHIGRERAEKYIAKLRRQGCAYLPDEKHLRALW
ncbi:minichromosome maintenance protein MCM [Methanococcoides vulcani]|uniref:minichromosome maintenance protein MCM n=1 Tax=Methanococcoides vulcani TaxID=1353158 RepID=UPI0014384F9C|nr:minichromosome maintenance protein MCM [Methanococcoides vulcani]